MPIKIIIDCDPGIDDALALMLAVASPELELLAVTAVAGNRPLAATAANARRVLDLAGAPGVPVHAGCGRPLAYAEPRVNRVHGEDGLGGAALPPARALDGGHAVDVLLALLNGHAAGSITLVPIGPLTNLALAELRQPGVLRRAACIAVMGGAVFVPGNVTPAAEFNFWADALAAHVVLTAGAPVQLFGLDATRQAVMSAAWQASLAAQQGTSARAAAAMVHSYAGIDPLLHDPCPLVWLIEPGWFGAAPHALAVEWRDAAREGQVLADTAPGARVNARVVTTLDTERVMALVQQRIATLP